MCRGSVRFLLLLFPGVKGSVACTPEQSTGCLSVTVPFLSGSLGWRFSSVFHADLRGESRDTDTCGSDGFRYLLLRGQVPLPNRFLPLASRALIIHRQDAHVPVFQPTRRVRTPLPSCLRGGLPSPAATSSAASWRAVSTTVPSPRGASRAPVWTPPEPREIGRAERDQTYRNKLRCLRPSVALEPARQ